MARTRTLTVSIALCLVAHTMTLSWAQSVGADGVIRTRERVFAIPFQIQDVRSPADLPSEVRLFVSADRGNNWQLENRWQNQGQRDPGSRQFTFRAPQDGEYWFKVQTIDSQGKPLPDGSNGPLRVLVDTVQPSLTLNVIPVGTAIQADWHFHDEHLDASTFQIAFRVADGGPLQPVPRAGITIPPVDPQQPNRRSGSARWETAVTSGQIDIIASVSDVCGNQAIVRQIAQVPSEYRSPSLLDNDNEDQDADKPEVGGPQGRQGNSPPPNPGGQVSTGRTPQTVWPSDDGSTRWPPSHTARRPLEGPRDANSNTSVADTHSPSGVPRGRGIVAPHQVEPAGEVAGRIGSTATTPSGSSSHPVATVDGSTAPLPAAETPAPPTSHFVNSRTFALDYEIDMSQSPGIASVELWRTDDGGRTWQFASLDNDRQSPLMAKVERDGLYGFRIVVDDVHGHSDPRPEPGDAPQMSVFVDQQPPAVQILAVEPDVAQRPGRLLIRWQAQDRRLAARPIALHYSDRPGGEWFVIATNLENRGEFTWQLPERMPREIYLRLAARDAAGNEAKDVTNVPVVLQRARPRGTLRGVRPSSISPPPLGPPPRATQDDSAPLYR